MAIRKLGNPILRLNISATCLDVIQFLKFRLHFPSIRNFKNDSVARIALRLLNILILRLIDGLASWCSSLRF